MVANATTMQGLDFDRVIGADDDAAEPRRRIALPRQAILGIALTGGGMLALLITWLQIKDIQNIAAQIPYVTSGGLLGVALVVMGAIAFFSATKPAAASAATVEELASQLSELQQSVKWTGDAIEQIADYLNELAAQNDVGRAVGPR